MFKLPSFQVIILIALMIAFVSCIVQIRLLTIRESIDDDQEEIKKNKKRLSINMVVIVLIGLIAFGTTYLK
ncbi:hypothetical protein [Priestia megaterium]|uniref:hypothetical protein n=1 Tax=Priestia megaterium TaxID=1404 RepID=UPI00203A83D1|nr:hypothetical protein [Priestia megaterium]MCM3196898.1 hypothetical protein [Priestia megaterium]